ncbi:MAG: hypothetical protein ACRBHB_00965 [Arenicella sp.]
MKYVVLLLMIGVLTACGKGGTSSSGSDGMPVEAKACIELDRDETDGNSFSIFTNDCDYDINVAELDGGSNEPSHLVKAGSRTTIQEYVVAWGACRAPYYPLEKSPFRYECIL